MRENTHCAVDLDLFSHDSFRVGEHRSTDELSVDIVGYVHVGECFVGSQGISRIDRSSGCLLLETGTDLPTRETSTSFQRGQLTVEILEFNRVG